jgi:hypothetical protein
MSENHHTPILTTGVLANAANINDPLGELDSAITVNATAIAGLGGTTPISGGGTGQTTAQAAIDALTQVSAATNEHVLTKDTATGNALWKEAGGGTGGDGWIEYDTVVPTRASADDPTYVLTFAGVDLTGTIGLGMRLKWTQNSTVRYGIVTAIAFSTNTTLTLYGGTDYDVDDTATYTISNFNYSLQKIPFGFPQNPDKWTYTFTDTTDRIQASPSQGTWYNLGSLSLSIPLGSWSIEYAVALWADNTSSSSIGIQSTLSTSSSSESDVDFRASYRMYIATGTKGIGGVVRANKNLTLTSKTTYYMLARATFAGTVDINFFNSTERLLKIKCICNYL